MRWPRSTDQILVCKLGEAYTRIEAWDDAITALEKGISISASMEFEVRRNELQSEVHRVLGQIYTEQYYSDESLMVHQQQEKKSYVKLHSALRKPSNFGMKTILASLPYILTWHRSTTCSAIQRKLKLCSRNAWTRP